MNLLLLAAAASADPAPTDPALPAVRAGLTRDDIDHVIRADMEGIKRCYERQLADYPLLVGKLVVKMVIGADGAVSEAETKSSSLWNPAMEQCVVERFLALQFPPPVGGGIVIVAYPFLFSPRASAIPSAVRPAVDACVQRIAESAAIAEPLVFRIEADHRRARAVTIGTEAYEELDECLLAAFAQHRFASPEPQRTIYSTSP